MRMNKLKTLLEKYADSKGINGKGPLSVVLVITRNASALTPPFHREDFLTQQGGQVAGLGRAAVQSILNQYGISRTLAEEGGRTSRGSIHRMETYISFLNDLHKQNLLDFRSIEKFWIDRVIEYFSSMPFKIKLDNSKSLRSIISELIEAAFIRQGECTGTMIAGAVMQHLVGAKLEIALHPLAIEHNGFSVADAPSDRKGDFLIGNTAIHVTTAPNESLIRKCHKNIEQNYHPVIITTMSGLGGAAALARNSSIEDRIDILEIEQFIATNILEQCGFEQSKRPIEIKELVKTYNQIINKCETDPSLKIAEL